MKKLRTTTNLKTIEALEVLIDVRKQLHLSLLERKKNTTILPAKQ